MKLWDPHFHIWDVSAGVDDAGYGLAGYERDVASDGFELIGGTFVEVMSARHAGVEGPAFADACAAEVDWVSRQLGGGRLPYVMVASAPLEQEGVQALLRQLEADDRVRGVRQIINHEPSWPRNGHLGNLLENDAWRQGYRLLAEHGLRFDLQLNPHQYAAAARLVAANPRVPVVIDHLGTPTLADLRGESYWEGMRALADCAHTAIKLSMLPYVDPEWDANALVTESVLQVIDLFGVERCFFASNFPVDRKSGWPAARLFGAFARLVGEMPLADRQRLFAANAMRAYGVVAGD
ncbi:MAG: amidohydrolase family protein [Spirochaetaceae bacterium]|nr:amidohydrolase family protein [Spirochaetaceae bacterium]